MTELYLVRHSAVNVPSGICYGHSDVPLLAPVENEAQRIRAYLPKNYIVFSSPLRRCLSLAETLGQTTIDARLAEINFGEWEMRSFDQIDRSLIDGWAADPLHFQPPGGESVVAMKTRVLAALDDILTVGHRNPVIVSHGGPLRAICGHLLDLPPTKWLSLEFAYGGLNRLTITPEGVILRGFN